MLTDIFSNRHASIKLFPSFEERHRRLLVQSFKLLDAHVRPFYFKGNTNPDAEAFWKNVHDRMAMELGLKSLSPLAYAYQASHLGVSRTQTGVWPINTVCENWMLAPFSDAMSADLFIKDRLSLIEIAFRIRSEEIAEDNLRLDSDLRNVLRSGSVSSTDRTARYQSIKDAKVARFGGHVEEINTRFRQSEVGLHYHNGYIQLTNDYLVTSTIEEPFWKLVAEPRWKNVDIDMKQAFDKRDGGDRDPAFYAARALESTIKIIADEKGWTTGSEKGAQNFIDYLGAYKNQYITTWEAETLKLLFSKVRNPLGHGPGNEPMPSFSSQATDWAIESCMSWIKSLIRRM